MTQKLNSMYIKRFVVVGLFNSIYPVYLVAGKVPLFDNFTITGVDLHFSTSISNAIRHMSETEAEVWINGILYLFPRFAPLSVIPVYDIEVLVPPDVLPVLT